MSQETEEGQKEAAADPTHEAKSVCGYDLSTSDVKLMAQTQRLYKIPQTSRTKALVKTSFKFQKLPNDKGQTQQKQRGVLFVCLFLFWQPYLDKEARICLRYSHHHYLFATGGVV